MSSHSALRIPPYPAVIGRVTRIVGKHGYTAQELARAVAADQALSATVLRLANSAKVASLSPVTSIERAVGLIGAREVVQYALAGSLGKMAMKPGPLATLRHRVWRDALASAHLCDELAALRGVPRDLAFLGGLLHDFGKIVLIGALEALRDAPVLPADEWMALLEEMHVEAGLRAAHEWKLPLEITAAIRWHHGGHSDPRDAKLVDLVSQMDLVVSLCGENGSVDEDLLGSVPGLSPSEIRRVLQVLPQVAETAASFTQPERHEPRPAITWVASASRGPARGRGKFAVSCERRDGPVLYTAVGIDWDALRLTGRDGLQENSLVKMTLHLEDGDLAMWMNVLSSRLGTGEHVMELRPYAMGGAVKAAYEKMTRTALTG